MNLKLLIKPGHQVLILLVFAATSITAGTIYYGISRSGKVVEKFPSLPRESLVKKVTALGRLEPEGNVIKLSAPLALDGDRLEQILVKETDFVKAGQVIAIMDSRNRLVNELLQAKKQLIVAKAKLSQVKAGAKAGDILEKKATVERLYAQSKGDTLAQKQVIARLEAQWLGEKNAQTATIGKLEAELKNAKVEYQRYQQLYSQGAISSSLFDGKRLSLETARQQLQEAKAILERINTTNARQVNEANVTFNRINSTGNQQIKAAKGTLNSVAEVRLVDIDVAQAEVENAIVSVKQAQSNLEEAYIRAPMAGQILKINTRPGEKITQSIAELAQTNRIIAIAEVYQTDIEKIKIGQPAVITSEGFTGELKGKVFQIDLQVKRQNTFSNQPGENLDSRVIEVKIRLNSEDSERVSGMTNLQIQTAIHLINEI